MYENVIKITLSLANEFEFNKLEYVLCLFSGRPFTAYDNNKSETVIFFFYLILSKHIMKCNGTM